MGFCVLFRCLRPGLFFTIRVFPAFFSACCLPIFLEYSQNLSAIDVIHVSFFTSIKKVTATLLLSLVHPTIQWNWALSTV